LSPSGDASRGWTGMEFPSSFLAPDDEMGKQPSNIADLKTYDEHGEFKKQVQKAMPGGSGSDKESEEDGCARRDKNQYLEKSPKQCA